MTAPRRLTNEHARRIAVRAQLLDAPRPTDLVATVERLTFLQVDPTAAIAPSADLVAWSRLGGTYSPAHLREAIERHRTLFEHSSADTRVEPVVAMVRPVSQLHLFLGEMAAWPPSGSTRYAWLEANDAFRRRVLDQLRAEGPLVSRDIPDTADVAWKSTGWTNDRNVTQLLEFLSYAGQVAVAGRRGKERVWDLAERVYGGAAPAVPLAQARLERDERRLRALGVARPKLVGSAGEPAEIEGTTGAWRVDPAATADDFEGRTAVLSPFDRLLHDRVRAVELFDFEYVLEMYKPAAKRRWGYFALPVLHHDRLVGKVDATADRAAGVLRVAAIHRDVAFTKAMVAAVHDELEALASWLGLGAELGLGAGTTAGAEGAEVRPTSPRRSRTRG